MFRDNWVKVEMRKHLHRVFERSMLKSPIRIEFVSLDS